MQRRHNCSPAASFANCVMTLYLLKVRLQTFLSMPITQRWQILSCDTLVANKRNVLQPVNIRVLRNILNWYLTLNALSPFSCNSWPTSHIHYIHTYINYCITRYSNFSLVMMWDADAARCALSLLRMSAGERGL